MPPFIRTLAAATALVALAAATPATTRAGSSGSLLSDPGLETLQGWRGYNATLSAVPGLAGTRAGRVAVSGSKTDYSIYPASRPVAATVAGTRYSASAWVRANRPGKTVCVRIREWSPAGALVGAAQSCAAVTTSWVQLRAAEYVVAAKGDSLDAYVYQASAASGDSFDVDDAFLGTGTAPSPPTTTTTTTTTTTPITTTTPTTTTPVTTRTAPSATTVDHAHVRLDWPAVSGASTYRVARGTFVVGTTRDTTFTDTLLWPATAYTWSVTALDAAGASIGASSVSATTAPLPTSGFPRPFGASTFWNVPLAGDRATSAANAGLMSYFVGHALNANLAIGEWSVPVSEVHPSDPLVPVACTMYVCTLGAFGAVPMPLTAIHDSSDDGHLALYDPASQREWDMWQGKGSGTTWSASAGAAVSMLGSGLAAGGTASGNAANFPLLGGLIRPEEILQGRIDHALVFGLPGIGAGAPVCPATHNAPTSTDPNALREGTLLQLDPAIDVAALPIAPWAKVVARAMQTYGMYLRDNSGSLAVYAENPLGRGYDPWRRYLGFAAGDDYPTLNGIPWSRFRVVAAPDYPGC